ncbi:MAG TPA: glycosyltransferase family 9 protein [Methylomirabilota bacterium]|nr:glycosyltransferase family 9 protein [Methylomirabilota bacterium]
MPSAGQILVIRGGAIGDFILTLPVLAALRSHFPGTRLEVLGYAHIASLAVAGGLADSVRPIEARSLAGFFARDGSLDPQMRSYFARFAVILSYLYDPEGVFQENVARCSSARFLAGPHRPDERGTVHACEALLQPLEALAIFAADSAPHLRLDPGALADEPALEPGLWVAMHPGSGSERKNWPERRWAEFLAACLTETPWQILLVGGEAEGDRLERLAARQPAGRIRLARNLPLPRLAGLLAGCAGYVGHDSGITHLAAALGLPGIVLWADTAEAVWRPRSPRFQLLRHPVGLVGLPAERVLAATRRLLE